MELSPDLQSLPHSNLTSFHVMQVLFWSNQDPKCIHCEAGMQHTQQLHACASAAAMIQSCMLVLNLSMSRSMVRHWKHHIHQIFWWIAALLVSRITTSQDFQR